MCLLVELPACVCVCVNVYTQGQDRSYKIDLAKMNVHVYCMYMCRRPIQYYIIISTHEVIYISYDHSRDTMYSSTLKHFMSSIKRSTGFFGRDEVRGFTHCYFWSGCCSPVLERTVRRTRSLVRSDP